MANEVKSGMEISFLHYLWKTTSLAHAYSSISYSDLQLFIGLLHLLPPRPDPAQLSTGLNVVFVHAS